MGGNQGEIDTAYNDFEMTTSPEAYKKAQDEEMSALAEYKRIAGELNILEQKKGKDLSPDARQKIESEMIPLRQELAIAKKKWDIAKLVVIIENPNEKARTRRDTLTQANKLRGELVELERAKKPTTTDVSEGTQQQQRGAQDVIDNGARPEGQDTQVRDPNETERLSRMADAYNNRIRQTEGVHVGYGFTPTGQNMGRSDTGTDTWKDNIETEDMRRQDMNRKLEEFKRQAEITLQIDKRRWDELDRRKETYILQLQNQLAMAFAHYTGFDIPVEKANMLVAQYGKAIMSGSPEAIQLANILAHILGQGAEYMTEQGMKDTMGGATQPWQPTGTTK
jgi:hypothetical protein